MTEETVADEPAQGDELVITLARPLELGGVTWHELRLREPSAGEWARWDDRKGVEADILAVSIVSGVPEPAIRKLGARDLLRASRFVAGFLA